MEGAAPSLMGPEATRVHANVASRNRLAVQELEELTERRRTRSHRSRLRVEQTFLQSERQGSVIAQDFPLPLTGRYFVHDNAIRV